MTGVRCVAAEGRPKLELVARQAKRGPHHRAVGALEVTRMVAS